MLKKIMVLVLFCSFLIVGCATPNITIVDNATGLPKSNYTMVTSSLTKNFQATFELVKMHETSQYSAVPEYLDLYGKYKISQKDTTGVYALLRVNNPTKSLYKIEVQLKVKRPNDFEFKDVVMSVYMGKDVDKYWQIPLPNYPATIKGSLAILDDKDFPILSFGEFNYIITE